MQAKILHLGEQDKFTAPLFALLEKHIDLSQHRLLSRKGNFPWAPPCNLNLLRKNGVDWVLNFLVESYRSDKIIIHGLFDSRVIFLLFLQPWLLKKCYWVIWGGDLYAHKLDEKTWRWKIKEFFKRRIASRIGNLITYVNGDVELARLWYSAKGIHHNCLAYPSNIYRAPTISSPVSIEVVNIQVGNSADISNNHIEIFEKLHKNQTENYRIFVPLSYGDKSYADIVIETGSHLFGDRFIPLTNFMNFSDYSKFLETIDIGIFNHQRQQGMGNIISLLGLGKKVFLRSDISHWQFFLNNDLTVNSIDDLELSRLEPAVALKNSRLIQNLFSEDNLVNQYFKIFSA